MCIGLKSEDNSEEDEEGGGAVLLDGEDAEQLLGSDEDAQVTREKEEQERDRKRKRREKQKQKKYTDVVRQMKEQVHQLAENLKNKSYSEAAMSTPKV